MATKIHGQECSLSKVFSNDFVFTMPLYQRPYSWEKEQAQQLLDDILTSINYDEDEPYFLGAIVLIKNEDNPHSEVIDGQQRLTTISILFATLRHVLNHASYKEALNLYIAEKGNITLGTEDRYRISLRKKDSEFFLNHIQKEDGLENIKNADHKNESQLLIKKNAILFLNQLKEMKEEDLQKLAMFLPQKCFLVVVSTPNKSSAFRIFSILNDRGLDLTISDILKASIIGQIPSNQQDNYNEKWENTEDYLGRDEFKNLFSYMHMIKLRAKARKSILEDYQKKINPENKPINFIDNELIPYSEALDIIRNSKFTGARSTDINSYLYWLNKLDNENWMPPAILYYSLHHNENDKILNFFRMLDRLAYGMFIIRSNVNKRISRYGKIIEEISAGKDLKDPSSSIQLTTSEKDQIIGQLNGPFYTIKTIRKLTLLRLDEALSSGGATYTYPTITVEHVLPQNPAITSNWIQHFSDKGIREDLVHKLGNLVLLDKRKNSAAKNYEFDKKKTAYFVKGGVSPFTITTTVIQESEWKPETINRKQTEYINKLKLLWYL